MKSARGLSLIEILFSVAIIGVILTIVANNYYGQNRLYLQVGKVSTQIQQLASVSYEWQAAQAQSNFQGISLATLQAAGLLDKSDTYSQINPWGGTITLAADNDDASYVLITLTQIPNDACVNLRNRMATLAHSQSTVAQCADESYHISL